MNIRRFALIVLFFLFGFMLWKAANAQGDAPPMPCPDGSTCYVVNNNSDELWNGDPPVSYTVTVNIGGESTLWVWTKVGHPESGCLPDMTPADNWMCTQSDQAHEQVRIFRDGVEIAVSEDWGANKW